MASKKAQDYAVRTGKELAARLGVGKKTRFDTVKNEVDVGYDGKARTSTKRGFEVDDDDDDSDSDSDSDTGPPTAGPGSLADEDDEIWTNEMAVDLPEMYTVDYLCQTDSTVKAAVELLINNLRSGGLAVTMDLFGTKIQLSREHRKVFDIEWTGIFLKDLVWSLLVFGFAVVGLVPSNVKKGEFVPSVIKYTTYMLTFVDKFNQPREYRVYPMNQGTGWEIYSRTKGRGARSTFNSDANVAVYVLYPPHPSNGALTSPLSTVYEKLLTLGYSWENFARADFYNANPTWGIQTTQSIQNVDPNETVNIGENHLGIYLEQQHARIDDQERADIRTAIEAGQQLHIGVAADLAAHSAYGRYGSNPSAQVPPYRSAWWPGNNRQIVEPPRPSYNTLFETITEKVTAAVSNVLNIPPQFLASDPTQHAANADMNLRLFDQAIRARQHDIEPILQDLFERAYKISHKNYKKEIYNEIKQSEDDEDIHAEAFKSHSRGESVDQFIRSTGNPSQSGVETRGDASKGDQIKVSKIMGRDLTTGPDGRKKKAKFGFSKPIPQVSEAQLKQLVASNVQFRISFRRTPLTDLASLQHAYDNDIIDYPEYAEDIGAVIGVDENHILTEEEHYAQKEKKTKIESDLIEKYGLEEEEEGGAAAGGGPGGAKKKPSAARKPKPSASSKPHATAKSKPKAKSSSGK